MVQAFYATMGGIAVPSEEMESDLILTLDGVKALLEVRPDLM